MQVQPAGGLVVLGIALQTTLEANQCYGGMVIPRILGERLGATSGIGKAVVGATALAAMARHLDQTTCQGAQIQRLA